MNGWYGALSVGLLILIEGLVSLSANKRGKLDWRSDAVRAASGGCVVVFAGLTILFGWSKSDIMVEYNFFYSFSFAGFILLGESFFSFMLNHFTRYKRESNTDILRFFTGAGITIFGTIMVFVTGS